ncbi:hypothetical protein RFI_34657, partial [Reticulomyxa filosa]
VLEVHDFEYKEIFGSYLADTSLAVTNVEQLKKKQKLKNEEEQAFGSLYKLRARGHSLVSNDMSVSISIKSIGMCKKKNKKQIKLLNCFNCNVVRVIFFIIVFLIIPIESIEISLNIEKRIIGNIDDSVDKTASTLIFLNKEKIKALSASVERIRKIIFFVLQKLMKVMSLNKTSL